MAQDHWNDHPDWAGYLERAGFAVLEQRVVAYERHPADEGSGAVYAARYAHAVFSRVRSGLAERLDPDDLATLDPQEI